MRYSCVFEDREKSIILRQNGGIFDPTRLHYLLYAFLILTLVLLEQLRSLAVGWAVGIGLIQQRL
jgi:hypothetical protein